MTEQHRWRTTRDDRAMWRFACSGNQPRRLRLYLCGGVRLTWGRLPARWWEEALDLTERFADGEDLRDERAALAARLRRLELTAPPYRERDFQAALSVGVNVTKPAYRDLLRDLQTLLGDRSLSLRLPYDRIYRDVRPIGVGRTDILRDLFGDPFQPTEFDPSWRTEHTVGIASKMYDDRNFGPMPILADALEEAGCGEEPLLTHCREAGVHVRGCWVVDSVLDRA